MLRSIWIMRWSLGLLCCCGCALLPHSTSVQPLHTVQLEQLVIQSSLPLPADHRLFQELTQLRTEILRTLELPSSAEPIRVYLFQDAEEFRGFVSQRFPNFPTRRAFFIETDTRLAVYAHWGDRVAEDLRHEVAHGYLHASVPQLPLWLDEGLAEYFEVARGQQGLNQAHVQELQARLSVGGWRPHLEMLEEISDAAALKQQHYAESWLWVHWLLHHNQESRQLLHEYLLALRGPGEPPTALSQRISAQFPQAETELLSYFARLTKTMPAVALER